MRSSWIFGAALALLAAGPALACTNISSQVVKLTGCVADDWVAGKGAGAQEFVYLTADQNYGMMVITEKEVFDKTKFHDAILANAIHGVGDKKEDISVAAERTETIDGKPFNVIEYEAANNGNPILFQNFYYSADGFGAVQILTYSLTTDSNAAAYKAGLFIATVKLGQ